MIRLLGFVLLALFLNAAPVFAKIQSISVYTGSGDVSTSYLEPAAQEATGYSKPLWQIDYLRYSTKYPFAYGLAIGGVPFRSPAGGGIDGYYHYANVIVGIFSNPLQKENRHFGAHMYVANGIARNEVHFVSGSRPSSRGTASNFKIMVGVDANWIRTPFGPITMVLEMGSTYTRIQAETGHTSESSFVLNGTQVMYGLRYWFGKEFRKK